MTGCPVRVVYLVGAQNCGSTLLEAILGNAPGAYGLGEVGGFHRFESTTACDCGQAPAACDPCRAAVSALAATGEMAAFRRLSPLPLKERRVYWTIFGTRDRTEYARLADALLCGVAAATGSHTLVDSSKSVGRAAALAHDSRNDVRIVHLVRDGRGYQRSRRRRAAAGGRRYRPAVALAHWVAKNASISFLLRPGVPSDRFMLCRYEDLVGDPETSLRRIGEFTGLDTEGLARAATGEGLRRLHLFEPPRRVDYGQVRLDPGRLGDDRLSPAANARWWRMGGFVSAWWGYDRAQSHLDGAGRVTATTSGDGVPS